MRTFAFALRRGGSRPCGLADRMAGRLHGLGRDERGRLSGVIRDERGWLSGVIRDERGWLSGVIRDERGSVAVLSAGLFAIMAAVGGIAVDLGMIHLEKRKAQAAVDLAAVSAAANLGLAGTVVDTVLAANGFAGFRDLVVTLGHYDPNPAVAAADRFVAGATPTNAVRVRLTKPAQLYFAKAFRDGTVDLPVEAIGAATNLAALSIGSRLLSLNGGLANAVLSQALGTSVSLDAMDYNALVGAQVDAFRTLDALATGADVTGLDYADLLAAGWTMPQVASAMAEAASGAGDSTVAAALRRLGQATAGSRRATALGEAIRLGPYGNTRQGARVPGFSPRLSVLSTVMVVAALAAGDRQIAVDVGASLPSLAAATLALKVGEPMQGTSWTRVGAAGATVSTAQFALSLNVTVDGTGPLDGIAVDLPILLAVAPAQARLTDIACSGRWPTSVTVAARPGLAKAWIGAMDPPDLRRLWQSPDVRAADLLSVPLLTVSGSAHAAVTDMRDSPLTFSAADIDRHRMETVATRDITTSLATSLVNDLDVSADGVGLPLARDRIGTLVTSQLLSVTPAIDTFLGSVLDLLGVGVGEADVRVDGVRCAGPGLVG